MRFGRVPLAASFAIGALVLPIGGAMAEPKPTIAQAKAKLEKLNDQADKVVDRYNLATERYKKARKLHGKLDTGYKKKLATVANLRSEIVTMAVDDYQFGEITSWPALMANPDPSAMLGSLTLATQMSDERAETLVAFDAENKALKTERDRARAALTKADEHRDEATTERGKILGLIGQQKKLLTRLGAYRVGDPNSTGVRYTGPASGNAAAVLSFAYAQVGKPYQYGGTGPGGWDCSGLTQASWSAAGVSIPRTTWEQWRWGASRTVGMDELQPGDLIFKAGLGHVVIYAGDGKIVHAPQTGDVVKIIPLSAYGGPYAGAIRP